MSTMIIIPPTLKAAEETLIGLDGLITAKQWHRAAIVAAYVETQRRGGDRRSTNVNTYIGLLTPNEFAALGIAGLSSHPTVRHYVTAWLDAGMPRPKPGQRVFLPDLPWPPNMGVGERDSTMTDERREALMDAGRQAGMRTGSKVVDVAANPKAVAAAIKADPATAKVAAEALAQVDDDAVIETLTESAAIRVRGYTKVVDDLAEASERRSSPVVDPKPDDGREKHEGPVLSGIAAIVGTTDAERGVAALNSTLSTLAALARSGGLDPLLDADVRAGMVGWSDDMAAALRTATATVGYLREFFAEGPKDMDAELARILDAG